MSYLIGAHPQRTAFRSQYNTFRVIENVWNGRWELRSAKRAGSMNALYTATHPSTHDQMLVSYLKHTPHGSKHFTYCVKTLTSALHGRFTASEVALAVGDLLIDRSFNGFKLEEDGVSLVSEAFGAGFIVRRTTSEEDLASGGDLFVFNAEGELVAVYQIKPKSFVVGNSASLQKDRNRLLQKHEAFFASTGIRVLFLFKEDITCGVFAPQLLAQGVTA